MLIGLHGVCYFMVIGPDNSMQCTGVSNLMLIGRDDLFLVRGVSYFTLIGPNTLFLVGGVCNVVLIGPDVLFWFTVGVGDGIGIRSRLWWERGVCEEERTEMVEKK